MVAIVFVKAFQVTPQWQAYDDIYRGRYNIKGEITLVLLLLLVVAIVFVKAFQVTPQWQAYDDMGRYNIKGKTILSCTISTWVFLLLTLYITCA